MSATTGAIRDIRYWDRKAKCHVNRRVRVTVDWDQLAQSLGPKAWDNKSGSSRLAAGVTVEALAADVKTGRGY